MRGGIDNDTRVRRFNSNIRTWRVRGTINLTPKRLGILCSALSLPLQSSGVTPGARSSLTLLSWMQTNLQGRFSITNLGQEGIRLTEVRPTTPVVDADPECLRLVRLELWLTHAGNDPNLPGNAPSQQGLGLPLSLEALERLGNRLGLPQQELQQFLTTEAAQAILKEYRQLYAADESA